MPQHIYHSSDLKKISFLVTGGAGFIGCNIAEYLLKNNAGKVRVLDNLSTGFRKNIDRLKGYSNFEFIEGDIRDVDTCRQACKGMNFISHQAALGSVPRSIKDPITTHAVNATGFLNMVVAAHEAGIKRFVYASTSSIYGDSPKLPKVEMETGTPLSPYAVSKKTNELYAQVFAEIYQMEFIGLRYFNVFGPHQSPEGAYAAVIPLFMKSVLENIAPNIDGDGNQTRDFCYVENVIQANVRSMLTDNRDACNKVYNIAVGERISINELFKSIAKIENSTLQPVHRASRPGDVRDSLADISSAKNLLGYNPSFHVHEGLAITLDWFRKTFQN